MMRISIQRNQLGRLAAPLALAARLWAGDTNPPPPAGKAMAAAIARQRQAVASMAASIETQRQAVQKQGGPQPAPSPFTLRPLPSLPDSPIPPMAEPVAACPPLPSSEIDSLVSQAARRENLAPELLLGVIRQESGARPCAVSPKGAMGLMQLMPATALQLGVTDAFDPKANVDAGARFLKQLLNLYGGDASLALGAFNAGPGRVNEAGGVPDFPETIDYVQKVLSFLP